MAPSDTVATSDTTATPDCGLVYVHGAGLDSWIWEAVTARLDAPQLPVSFPGRGGRSVARENLSLEAYVDHVRQQVDDWPVERVIVVAHSIGGVVGLELAGERPERVAGFVGVCAAIPNPGGSFVSCYPFHQRIVQRAIIRLLGTKPPDPAIRRSLCSGLSDERTERVVDQFTAESRRLYTDRGDAAIPDVPTLYVKTTNDKELSPSLQDSMTANLRADGVATIAAGHMPMLSDPQAVAEILERFEEGASNAPQ